MTDQEFMRQALYLTRLRSLTLSRAFAWCLPAEQEKMMPAQFTSVGLKQPVKGILKPIPRPHSSKLNRSAMGTSRVE